MKAILFVLFPALVHANNKIDVPFEKLGQSVRVTIGHSRCSAEGDTAYQVEAAGPSRFDLVCQLRESEGKYDSRIPIQVISDFKYPQSILKDIQTTAYSELKSMGTRAIKKKKHTWGTEYYWPTPTFSNGFYTYLCPQKSKHCFRTIHGGVEYLTFEIQNKS